MLLAVAAVAMVQPSLVPVQVPSRVGLVGEWKVEGLPVPDRPFDDGEWRLVATIERPKREPAVVEAFWYAPFTPAKDTDSKQVFTPSGTPGWRLRFTPMDPGAHRLELRVTHRGQLVGTAKARFRARPGTLDGFLRVSPENPHYLATADGRRFLAIGWNAAWWNAGGLDDYERWAERMQAAGMNYARLWMSPWCFGIENAPGQLGNYGLDAAWALDETLRIFRRRGVHVILCFDYHGMLQEDKDFWGGNDNWRLNPYNAANGGPAQNQNEFFTSPEARRLYQQRLRYIVARYGAYPNVGVWEFWNEIDNVARHFRAEDMIGWHRDMAAAVRAMDPYGRLVSTSLTHDGYPTIWTEANLDLVQSHSYNQTNPGPNFAERTIRFRERYEKPYILGEYGVDYRAPALEDDPKSRGLKQALWASLLGGGAGTAQSWWWETLDAQGIYPMFKSIADFARQSPIGQAGWRPIRVAGPEESSELPPAAPGASPMSVRLPLVQAWGEQNPGMILLTERTQIGAQAANLNGYVHGTSKPELQRPFRLRGHWGDGARVGVFVNSVSDAADLRWLIDGVDVGGKRFPDRDGKTEVNGEYGEELWMNVPAGTRTVELKNVGPDWAALDWVEVQGALTAARASADAPPVRGVASGTATEAVLWILDPTYSYPANAKEREARTLAGAWVELPGREPGAYIVTWWDTAAGRWTGETEASAGQDGRLRVQAPAFQEDVAALIRKR